MNCLVAAPVLQGRPPRPEAAVGRPPTHPSWATHAYSYRARGEAAHGPSFRRKSRFATNGRWSWMHHNGSAATPRPAAAAVRTAGTSSSLLARLSVRRCWCSDSPGHRRRCRRGGRVPFTVKACAESASPYLLQTTRFGAELPGLVRAPCAHPPCVARPAVCDLHHGILHAGHQELLRATRGGGAVSRRQRRGAAAAAGAQCGAPQARGAERAAQDVHEAEVGSEGE